MVKCLDFFLPHVKWTLVYHGYASPSTVFEVQAALHVGGYGSPKDLGPGVPYRKLLSRQAVWLDSFPSLVLEQNSWQKQSQEWRVDLSL